MCQTDHRKVFVMTRKKSPRPELNPRLLLSEGNRKATKVDEEELEHPVDPDRFVNASQVMKDIGRTRTEASLGFNEKSRALDCLDARFMVRHENITAAEAKPVSSRVDVYLDQRAGTLSFNNVSETADSESQKTKNKWIFTPFTRV